MPSNKFRNILFIAIALILLAGCFSGGVVVGWQLPAIKNAVALQQSSSNPAATQTSGANVDTLFKPFWETWKIVHDQYVDQPVNDVELMRGAISGMLAALKDPHTSYMDPTEYKQQNAPLQGSYEGIGAWVDTTGDYLKIISPMVGSPAEKAGLKPLDLVIAVDGVDMTGQDGTTALNKVLGPAGTNVTLTIKRGDANPMDFVITRAKITIASVQSKMLDHNIAYIQLTTFGETTTSELKTSLQDLLSKNPDGLILDLRNNGGGYLNTAIEVVSQFIPNGTVMYEQYGDGTKKTYTAIAGGIATKIPLVVLVNEGTASASEITAGAIQDTQRGKLVGVKTYGKGSVQNWIVLDQDQGAVRVTIAHWLTPNGRQINKLGLTPDVVVTLSADDLKNNRDPQLDKAVELLTTGK
jgi:carboxyl-terminal processing protease